ncbi:MAG: glycoside hydrolase family 2 TIM barrel-domain containing protein [Nibricoccus sp.]
MKAFPLGFLLALCAISTFAQPVDVLPVRVGEGAQSLNGSWRFKYVASSDIGSDEAFIQPSFDDTMWSTIAVPSHWELAGFAEPQYADDLKEGTGLYRRTFRTPKGWQGQRVFLRFEGVQYGLTAWVNGKPVGEWASSYNPVTFDITDALAPSGSENVLAVRVTTRSKGWNFDTMDCWALSGIYRDVSVFALPTAHLADYTSRATLKPNGSAVLHLDFAATAPAKVIARLYDPRGTLVRQADVTLSPEGRGSVDIDVSKPQLWTAESPSLYGLVIDLSADSKIVQRFSDRVGLRQVTIEEGILKLNGTPIKLRGVDHHDIWPEGRVATEQGMQRDLQLIRRANINFIRTSHYPPHPRFLELCDEMGFYVDDEVPFIHGRKNLTDPDYQDVLYTRARATVMRDKNRPSVIFWSVGNENPIVELNLNTGKYVKQLDPTRPVTLPTIGSYFRENYQKFPEFVDLYASHYPPKKVAAEFAEKLTRPVVFTEYAHQRGVARGGTAVQELWEMFYRSPRIAGGAIWMFQDQGILRTTEDRQSVKDGDLMVWLDEHRYYDTHGFFAMDGLVYSDRTPQVDYWQVRKVYSPVQIQERELPVKPGEQAVSLHVENRYDFKALAGYKLHWVLQRNGVPLQDGSVELHAKPHETEPFSIDLKLPAELSSDVFKLGLRCEDEKRTALYERSLRLDTGALAGARWSAIAAALPKKNATLEMTDATAIVHCANYRLKLDRQSGKLSLLDSDGREIVAEFGPHVGHNPTINDIGKGREREPMIWRGSLLSDAKEVTTDARTTADGVEITVRGTYARPGVPEQSVRGAYKLFVSAGGAIKVSYRYTPNQATGEMLEAGFALSLPKTYSEFRWLGEGPYAGYPGKDRLNEYGTFHLHRDDLYFPGNRRSVEFASIANPDGVGVLLSGDRLTVDVENKGETTVFSHVALVPGEKNTSDGKGDNVEISSRLNAAAIKEIAGEFTLLPLDAIWPRPLMAWLGQPSDRVKVNKPFLSSYDR